MAEEEIKDVFLLGFAIGVVTIKSTQWMQSQTDLRLALAAAGCPDDLFKEFVDAGDQVAKVVRKITDWADTKGSE